VITFLFLLQPELHLQLLESRHTFFQSISKYENDVEQCSTGKYAASYNGNTDSADYQKVSTSAETTVQAILTVMLM